METFALNLFLFLFLLLFWARRACFSVAADVRESPVDRNLIDGFLDSVFHQIHPHGSLVMLPDTMHTGDSLEFDGGVDEWFAEEDVRCVD